MKEAIGKFINLPLIANPYNWLFVLAVAFFVGLSLCVIFPAAKAAKTEGENQ